MPCVRSSIQPGTASLLPSPPPPQLSQAALERPSTAGPSFILAYSQAPPGNVQRSPLVGLWGPQCTWASHRNSNEPSAPDHNPTRGTLKIMVRRTGVRGHSVALLSLILPGPCPGIRGACLLSLALGLEIPQISPLNPTADHTPICLGSQIFPSYSVPSNWPHVTEPFHRWEQPPSRTKTRDHEYLDWLPTVSRDTQSLRLPPCLLISPAPRQSCARSNAREATQLKVLGLPQPHLCHHTGPPEHR